MTGPDSASIGRVVADHLPPILYALEVCAVQMADAGRDEDAGFYRQLASTLADAAGGRAQA